MTSISAAATIRKTRREIGLGTLLAVLVFGPTLMVSGQSRTVPPAAGFPDLVGGLKSTPGCLGVETAQTATGKQVIFAWFENKKAVLNWYYSDVHRSAVQMFAPGAPARTPMADIPDDGGPVLAIASLTPVNAPPTAAMPLPVSQISIELYRPLPGGLSAGGTFAPAGLHVPGMTKVAIPGAVGSK
jgi:hypothetical protein